MKLDEKQKERLVEYFKEKFAGRPTCPLCAQNTWHAAPNMFQVHTFAPEGLAIDEPVMPLVAIQCQTCSNVQFFSALAMRILPREVPEQLAPEEAGKETEN